VTTTATTTAKEVILPYQTMTLPAAEGTTTTRSGEEGGHIIARTTTTMDTDAATIAVGTTLRGEKGAVASSGGRLRVCVNFGQPSPSSTSAIVTAVD
jgi:hypothetical protein